MMSFPQHPTEGQTYQAPPLTHVQREAVKAASNRLRSAGLEFQARMLDAELDSVPDELAPGVGEYRTALTRMFGKRSINAMPHEDIIDKLDEGAQLFNVLILKTDMTIPYTSVFIQLDCGYWSAEQESALRKAIKAAENR